MRKLSHILLPPDYPSGIVAIQTHQILGLGFRKITRNQGDDIHEEDYQVEYGDLPNSYCTVIVNHQGALKDADEA